MAATQLARRRAYVLGCGDLLLLEGQRTRRGRADSDEQELSKVRV